MTVKIGRDKTPPAAIHQRRDSFHVGDDNQLQLCFRKGITPELMPCPESNPIDTWEVLLPPPAHQCRTCTSASHKLQALAGRSAEIVRSPGVSYPYQGLSLLPILRCVEVCSAALLMQAVCQTRIWEATWFLFCQACDCLRRRPELPVLFMPGIFPLRKHLHAHLAKTHRIFSPARHYALGDTCSACFRVFPNVQQVHQHLKHSSACLMRCLYLHALLSLEQFRALENRCRQQSARLARGE